MSAIPNASTAALIRLIELEEAERRHVAHLLHSDIGQNLTAALLSLQFFAEGGLPAEEVEGVSDSVRDALQQVRALSLRLRPPLLDEIGLASALRSTLEQISLQREFRVEFSAAEAAEPLPGWLAISLFRWVQALAEQTPAQSCLSIVLQAATDPTAPTRLDLSLTGADLPQAWQTESAARADLLGARVLYRGDGLAIELDADAGRTG
jgi:two-component system sensor histidine kinase UhpB